MSATVMYKGATLTTINNATKKLLTAGKYMEDDVTITDVTQSGIPIGIASSNYNISTFGLTWTSSAEEEI